MADASGKAAEVERKYDDAASMAKSNKMLGRVMTVLVVGVALGGVWMMLSPLVAAAQDTKPYQAAMKKELDDRVVPALQRETKEMLETVGPQVGEAVMAKLRERAPRAAHVLEEEALKLALNLSNHAKETTLARAESLGNNVYDRVVKDIPELADEEVSVKSLDNARIAVNATVERLIDEYLKEQVDSVTNIQTRLEAFPIHQRFKTMSDQQLREALADTMAIVVTQQFRDTVAPKVQPLLDAGK